MTITRIEHPLTTSTDSATLSLEPFNATRTGHGDRCGHGRRIGAAEATDADLSRCGACGQPLGCWETDRLTGLLNRWGWDDEAPAAFRRVRRRWKDIALMLIDVDWFKAINDELGHPAGDSVLKEVAYVLSSSTRRHDVVSRYGGDEFLILLPDTAIGEAIGIADRILRGIRRIDVKSSSGTTVILKGLTASIGVAAYAPERNETLADLLEDTDAALRRAKADGRGRVCVYDPSTVRTHVEADRAFTSHPSTCLSRVPIPAGDRTALERPEDLRDLLNLRHLMNSDWMPDVLHALADGPRHHGDLLAAIRSSEVIDEWSGRDRNIQSSILNRTLRRLVDYGFVYRYEEPGVWPRSVRYELSEAAREWLSEVLPAVSRWCDRHGELISQAQHRRNGDRCSKPAED